MLELHEQCYEQEERGFEAALRITRALGDRPGEAQSLRGLGLCYQRQGNSDTSKATLLEALALVRQPRRTFMEALVLEAIAEH